MSEFERELARRLESLRAQGLYRELRRVDSPQTPYITIAGRRHLNFSSNDYLGLAFEPSVRAAAAEAAQRYGGGSGASRLICGSLLPHHQLEEALAEFKGAEAALAFSSGWATASGAICALMGKGDIIVLDKLVHASAVDAARLSGATLRVFSHNDMEDLESILRWCAEKMAAPSGSNRARTLVVTESVFSMDGDRAPLREIVDLKDRFGAWLMVDEAHAVGLLGAHGRGLADELGVADRIEAQMGTLGKALGAAGGYICGSRILIDYLINRARSFIFSTAPVPAAAAAALAGVNLARGPEGDERRARLWSLARELTHSERRGAIIPIPVGDENEAMRVAAVLREEGIFIPAVRFPTVARGSARLRLTLSAAHQPEDIRRLAEVLARLGMRI